ncbi:superoxide dismutase family protein [Virgibacillus sp. W0430]|uniref:superoxide dismutase family protein n=1 Tax=Virgibacillus sp. W0430 TaxID=3391580 RepID=UPI003F45EB66
MRLLFLLIFTAILLSCQTGAKTAQTVNMYNTDGDMVGTAKLSETPDGINIKLKLEGLTPGFHGIHVHEYPKCEGPDFISAGNHFNPDGKEHGLMHPKGAHLGDLPNIEADASGIVDIELMLAEATLLDGKQSLLKGEGTSLIVTKDPDDGMSQPGGNGGTRIICGKISPDTKENETPTDPTESNEKEDEG